MSIVELERPSPAGTATRHGVSVRPRSLRAGGQPCQAEPFDDLAIVFPSRRLCGTAPTTLARRSATGFDAGASATAWLIAEGLRALDPERRQSIVQRWSEVRGEVRDHGPPLVGDAGCDVRLGHAALGATERAALLAWLPLTHRDLAVFEGGLFVDAPANAIALLVRPPTIWSLDEAQRAERLFPRGRRFAPERFAAIERHAYDLVRAEHMTRVRASVERIARQLPILGLPVASKTVAAGRAAIDGDRERCRMIAARQLARYASSSSIALAAD